uniref:Uncharacterized protein n=1 Tax=Arundo donax TaxID=35708 RepID=A0A0A9DSR4_ARUDO
MKTKHDATIMAIAAPFETPWWFLRVCVTDMAEISGPYTARYGIAVVPLPPQ